MYNPINVRLRRIFFPDVKKQGTAFLIALPLASRSMEELWDPERLRIVGSILNRYSAHIAPGHRIRLGMEGDPCNVYRSGESAPRATVLDVRRDANGLVQFRAKLDDSDTVIDLDNRTVSADRIWEIDPEYLEIFRGHVSNEGAPPSPVTSMQHTLDASLGGERDMTSQQQGESTEMVAYRSSVEHQLTRLGEQMEHIESSNRTFRETMASTVRALAGDLLRTSHGAPIEFAHQYADRYDLAVAERMSDGVVAVGMEGEQPEMMSDEFRGEERSRRRSPGRRNSDRYQGEKYDFDDATQPPIRESDKLTDDGVP